MEFADVLYEASDGVATITINRPKLLNAFRAQTVDELCRPSTTPGAIATWACVILTGAGEKAFCAGGDQTHPRGQAATRASLPVRLGARHRGPPRGDPRHPEAGDRRRQRLRDRRRARAARDLRPDDRRRHGEVRAGGAEGRQRRPGLRHRVPRARRRREEGARDLVPLRAVHGRGVPGRWAW